VPKGNPGNWANTNDYPARALQQEREGTTGFRVTVGPDGRVQSCSVTSSSGHADLDEATCKNIQRRGRFDPALDASGNPTTGSWSSRVRWQIPK
jgi:protein TonB